MVSIGSIYGMRAMDWRLYGAGRDVPRYDDASYAVSKAALNMVTRLIAAELQARDIAVISLHPGWVRTDMGGASAPLGVAESVAGMLRVIDALTPADSGRFLGYDGCEVPW